MSEQRKWHCRMLVLFLAFLGGVLFCDRVTVLLPLKNSCLSRQLFNVECPGCGIVHAVNAALRLDLARSLRYNAAGPIVAALLILHILYFSGRIVLKADISFKLEAGVFALLDNFLLLSLAGAWLYRLCK